MRFRLSTLLLALAFACVVLGWVVTEWQHRISHANVYTIASEFARYKAYNDVYGSMDSAPRTPAQDQTRRRLLQNTVKSTASLLKLPIPDRHEVLSYEYKSALQRIAFDALSLLSIGSPIEFRDAIIADGDLELQKWESQHPEIRLDVQVLDPDTQELKSEFAEYLNSIFEYGKP